jgi:hypothetical protein
MRDTDQLNLGMVNRPYPGQDASGDWPFYYTEGDKLLLGLVDSLGHGPSAHAGSMRIKEFLDMHWQTELPRLFDNLHAAVQGGVGAAICMAQVALDSGDLRWAGIGNIRASVLGSSDQRFVSRDGILGQHYRTPIMQEACLVPGDKLVFVSDGIRERLFTQCDRAEFSRNPDLLADYLLRHYGKNYDDASCLIFEF